MELRVDMTRRKTRSVKVGAKCKEGKHHRCFVRDCECLKDGKPCHGEWKEEA